MMITEFHEKLKNGATCVSLVQEYFERIDKYESKVNAFITVTKEIALVEAEKVDNLIKSRQENFDDLIKKYPLLGIPVGYKDLFSTKGTLTTAASNILKNYIPPYDATVVEKVKNAGAIMIGKLNCDAFGHGATGHNSDFGDTYNPYDLSRVPGGSSSGSGAAVATDMVMVGFGTDTGSSVRSPANWCNLVGIKPTYGRVSRYGISAMGSSLDTIGHLTKTVEDNARILQVTAGFDKSDSTSSKNNDTNYLSTLYDGVKGLRIGIPKEYFTDDIDPEIKETALNALKTYQNLGAELVDISLPNTKYALAVYYILTPSEVSSNLGRYDGIRFGFKRESFGDEAKRRIMIGTYVLSEGYYDAYYLKALKVRELLVNDFKSAFEKVDVIIAPVAPMDPPKIGEDLDDPLKMYLIDVLTVTANLTQSPSLSVPAGFSSAGLPIGIQIMGKHFDEATLYRVAYSLEKELKLYERKPNL